MDRFTVVWTDDALEEFAREIRDGSGFTGCMPIGLWELSLEPASGQGLHKM